MKIYDTYALIRIHIKRQRDFKMINSTRVRCTYEIKES